MSRLNATIRDDVIKRAFADDKTRSTDRELDNIVWASTSEKIYTHTRVSTNIGITPSFINMVNVVMTLNDFQYGRLP